MHRLLWVVLVVLAALVAPARAECWTRNDGVEICSHEPVEWIAVWWVWLGLLVVAGTLIGYCNWCMGSTTQRTIDDHESTDLFQEPLLGHGELMEKDQGGGDNSKRVRIQPVYRYLD